MSEVILNKLGTLWTKVTSRKFLGTLIGILMGAYIIANGDVTAGTTLIGAVICGYNVAEAYVDGKSVSANGVSITANTTSKEFVENYLGLNKEHQNG